MSISPLCCVLLSCLLGYDVLANRKITQVSEENVTRHYSSGDRFAKGHERNYRAAVGKSHGLTNVDVSGRSGGGYKLVAKSSESAHEGNAHKAVSLHHGASSPRAIIDASLAPASVRESIVEKKDVASQVIRIHGVYLSSALLGGAIFCLALCLICLLGRYGWKSWIIYESSSGSDGPEYLDFKCPAKNGPGDLVQVTLPDGTSLQVTIPDGVHGGMNFSVQV